ncbi:hypothetical protein ER17_01325 [Mycobacterium tuberculosis]|nr:hypothetical protein ER17_01325 [Mycobacterium tuberculosis]KAK28470.1 hypothetical protein AZ55_02210 [Mycobacterium tuberculosis CWCFVRF MDRTB 670]KDM96682.1 hypothetical protein EE54_01330 [Mycobacterium tuberculosis]KEC53827.1 hypothetical protein EW34_00435 [Mycobacterium tuberculosis variant bovis BCG]
MIRRTHRPGRIMPYRELLRDGDALRLSFGWGLVGAGNPDGQHTGVIGSRDGLAGDVRGQPERAAE